MYKLTDLILMFGISERTLRRHISKGILPGTKMGGIWHFDEEQIKEYLNSGLSFDELKRRGNRDIIDFINDSRDIKIKNACLILDKKELSTLKKNKIVMHSNKIKGPFKFKYHKYKQFHRFVLIGDIESITEFSNYINTI